MNVEMTSLFKLGIMLISFFPFCYWLCNHEYKLFVSSNDYDELMSDEDTVKSIRNKVLLLNVICYSIPIVLFSSLLYTMTKWVQLESIFNLFGRISFVLVVLSCIYCFHYNTYYCFISKTPPEDNEDDEEE